ncbi:MAG: transporter permease [Sphingomonadales bacterium]|nr:transporter permease [Sphingomonadales bacterium]
MTDAQVLGWAASWRIARRDLHAGFRGLRLLFICLLLGVTTLAAIGSLTASITGELSARGRTLLGGDIEVAMTQRQASSVEHAALAGLGRVSDTIRTRAMARGPVRSGAPGAVLTEIKGVDAAYPLYGQLTLAQGRYRQLANDEVLIDRSLADRLLLRTGGTVHYGEADFRIVGVIDSEPDRVGEGFTLGPVAIVSMGGLERTKLLQPGALYETKYRVRLKPGIEPAGAIDALKARYPSAGWEYKDRDRAAPGAARFFERMGQFLSLIGLAALVIAGIGVSNGVASYLALKRNGIATLKILGATSGDIARIYLMQIGVVALLAVFVGLVLGAILPVALITLARDILPVQPGVGFFPVPLAVSAVYGLLIALAFALPPLARARMQPAAAQFRGNVDDTPRLDRRTMAMVAVAALLVIALALGTARDPLFAGIVLGSVAGVLLLLLGVGSAIRWLAIRIPRPRRPLLRLALANLHRPGAQTVALVIALGLALTLFVTLAAIQTSLNAEITRTVPQKAPNQFVLDIPSESRGQFVQIVHRAAPEAQLNIVPSLRGTIVAYGGQRVADLKEIPEGAWFLRGERGVTYSDVLPQGSDLTAGKWWPRDYAGPPLVSLDQAAADILKLRIGDTMTVSVLGREIEARIGSLRKVNWDTMGFNYVLVFSPNALQAAPHSLTSTITIAAAHEGAVARALLAAFPSASIIAVSEVISQVRTLLDQMATAIVLSASVAILAGIAVLIGAIAASRQTRSYDSVILKTLGATRWQILGAQGLEYALLAALLATVAFVLGIGAAWYVIVEIFKFTWAPDWWVVLGTLTGGAVLTLGIGLLGSLPLLSIRPAQALRRM